MVIVFVVFFVFFCCVFWFFCFFCFFVFCFVFGFRVFFCANTVTNKKKRKKIKLKTNKKKTAKTKLAKPKAGEKRKVTNLSNRNCGKTFSRYLYVLLRACLLVKPRTAVTHRRESAIQWPPCCHPSTAQKTDTRGRSLLGQASRGRSHIVPSNLHKYLRLLYNSRIHSLYGLCNRAASGTTGTKSWCIVGLSIAAGLFIAAGFFIAAGLFIAVGFFFAVGLFIAVGLFGLMASLQSL